MANLANRVLNTVAVATALLDQAKKELGLLGDMHLKLSTQGGIVYIDGIGNMVLEPGSQLYGAVMVEGIEDYRARNQARLTAKNQPLTRYYFCEAGAVAAERMGNKALADRIRVIAEQGSSHSAAYNQARYYELKADGTLNFDAPYVIEGAAAYGKAYNPDRLAAEQIARVEERMQDRANPINPDGTITSGG